MSRVRDNADSNMISSESSGVAAPASEIRLERVEVKEEENSAEAINECVPGGTGGEICGTCPCLQVRSGLYPTFHEFHRADLYASRSSIAKDYEMMSYFYI